MKIAIDASSAAVRQRTGVAKYIHRLIENLEGVDGRNEYTVYYRLSRRGMRDCFYEPKKPSVKVGLFQEPFSRCRGITVFHGPDARLPRLHGPKLVATVHDVFSLVSEEFANDRFRRKKISHYRRIAERADRIICVSESTRHDFLRFFPEAEPKTRVIYEGVDWQFCPRPNEEIDRIRSKYGIETDYIFYVGTLCLRKNILRMFEAFLDARKKLGADIQFIAAGKLTYGKDEILKWVERNNSDGRIRLPGYVPEADLPALYTGARLFLFTTLYEGFGLPVLEALACGTPVITSNVSAMNEVGAEATHRVDPRSTEAISQKIIDVLHAPGKVALDSVPRWRDMARATLALYEELGNKP
ncbi:MAG: glycosyltransferase family 1 protein [Candidatus Abyssubacteria bacterium]